MRTYLKVATWSAVSSILVMTVTCTDLDLTGDPVSVVDNGLLTMSCRRTTDSIPPLAAVRWQRNTEVLFQTVGGNIQPDDSNTTEYDEVSGRITVTTKQQEHRVMLRINFSLDNWSVWRCSVDTHYSENLRIVVLNPTTVATLITTAPHHGPISTDLPSGVPNVYAIAGSSAGLVIIIVLIGFAVVRMKHTAVARNEEPEVVYGDYKEEEPENDTGMVDNTCYVGFVEVGEEKAAVEALKICVSDESNTRQASRVSDTGAGMASFDIDDDLYAKPVKKAERKVIMDQRGAPP